MPKQTEHRVVVTGLGAVTAAGTTWLDTWNAIMSNRAPCAGIKRFDATTFPTQISYEVDLDQLQTKFPRHKDASLTEWFLQAACEQALNQAQLNAKSMQRARGGAVLGCGMGSPDFHWFSDVYCKDDKESARVIELRSNFPHTLTEKIQTRYGLRGPSVTVHTACASSGQSIGEAFEILKAGEAEFLITGGVDSMINPFHVAGFCLLGALSKRNSDPTSASRPFDAERDGFVLGEGACVLILERLDHAVARGAKILAEITGYGVTESAYRITDLHPEGIGPIEAMQMAIDDSQIQAQEVGYVNAHGTSTLLNDRVEALAIERVFGTGAKAPWVSSTKSVTGHMISAAGAIELAACIAVLNNETVPPSTNLYELDGACHIRTSIEAVRVPNIRAALSNSVGFGGSNTALIVQRHESSLEV